MPTKPNTPGQSGGEQTNDPSSGQSAEPTRPAGLELVDYNAPALKVKITVNPELELTLSRTNEILDVEALNADAEGLLAGMDLVGQPYESGIVTILEEAKEQEYLKDLSKVSVTVEELSEGAWTIVTGKLLTQPIEDYQQNSGVIFSCRLTPAGESLDIEELTVLETARTEGIFVTVYGDAAGNAKMMIYESDDGTRQEVYMISDTEVIGIIYYPDGSYQYGHNDGLVDQGYGEYPDGRRYTYIEYRELVDGLTQPVWYEKTYSDGSAEEYFYENSEWIRTAFTNADGSTWETFYENGTVVSEVWKNADGSTQESFYENGQPVRDVITTPDGLTQETLYENGQPVRMVITTADGSTQESFYENGQPVRMVITTADGSTQEILYENGQPLLNEGTTANGGTVEQTYYPNGNLKTYTESREGTYVEQHYDENGLMISLFQRDPDGTEHDWEYENGEPVGCTVTYPDGSTQVMSFGNGSTAGTNPDGSTYEQTHYPNGNLKSNTTTWPNGDYSKQTYYENGNWETSIEFREGSYTEAYYDENGMLTSSFRREPDGTECEYGYQNGNLKTCKITWSNGDYCNETYYENGNKETYTEFREGTYVEHYYDENGLMTSLFEHHSDGTEYDWDYENGEAVGYTVTYPDGSSEYHSYAP